MNHICELLHMELAVGLAIPDKFITATEMVGCQPTSPFTATKFHWISTLHKGVNQLGAGVAKC